MAGVAEATGVLEAGVETLEAQLGLPRAMRLGEAVGVAAEELGTEEYQPNSPRTARGGSETDALELAGAGEAECQSRAATVREAEGEADAEEYQSRATREAPAAEEVATDELGAAVYQLRATREVAEGETEAEEDQPPNWRATSEEVAEAEAELLGVAGYQPRTARGVPVTETLRLELEDGDTQSRAARGVVEADALEEPAPKAEG